MGIAETAVDGDATGRLTDADHMAKAIAWARRAGERGEVPIGAVLVAADGTVLAQAGNASIATNDPTAHAEVLVLREAGRKLGNYRLLGTSLYVTIEPCPMCAGALVHARVARLVYGAADPRAGACGTVFDLVRSANLNHRLEVVAGVAEPECAALLKAFFAQRR